MPRRSGSNWRTASDKTILDGRRRLFGHTNIVGFEQSWQRRAPRNHRPSAQTRRISFFNGNALKRAVSVARSVQVAYCGSQFSTRSTKHTTCVYPNTRHRAVLVARLTFPLPHSSQNEHACCDQRCRIQPRKKRTTLKHAMLPANSQRTQTPDTAPGQRKQTLRAGAGRETLCIALNWRVI